MLGYLICSAAHLRKMVCLIPEILWKWMETYLRIFGRISEIINVGGGEREKFIPRKWKI